MLINMKMPTKTNVGMFIFISRGNFLLSCVEHNKSFLTSGQDNLRLSYLELAFVLFGRLYIGFRIFTLADVIYSYRST